MKCQQNLVIGSVHLDAIANFEDAGQETAVDKIGTQFRLATGGAVFNVARHLKALGHETLTILLSRNG